MKKIEYNGKTITIPQDWNELTLAQYEALTQNPKADAPTFLRTLATICRTDAETLSGMPHETYNDISASLQFITETKVEPATSIEIDGVTYSVAQSDGLTLGEWVDVDMIMKSNSPCKLADILSVVCRPEGEPYKAELCAQRRDMFASLTCDKAMRPIGFFLHRKKESDEILNLCSEAVRQANRSVRDIERLVINGDGIKQLPTWQRIKYIYLIKSLKLRLSRFSDFSSIRSTKGVPMPINTVLNNK